MSRRARPMCAQCGNLPQCDLPAGAPGEGEGLCLSCWTRAYGDDEGEGEGEGSPADVSCFVVDVDATAETDTFHDAACPVALAIEGREAGFYDGMTLQDAFLEWTAGVRLDGLTLNRPIFHSCTGVA